MTYNNFREFEFTAFSGSDLLEQGDTQLSCGDSFTMPVSATACITVTDNDSSLSGDARRNEEGDDRSGQTADIELNGQQVGDDVKIYAERYTVLHDEDGNCYFLIEIEIAGSASDDNNDFFAFYGDVPPAGAELTVVSTGNVCGNWLQYKKLSAGLKWDADEDGKITIEAEDMALKGYRVDDIDDASGGEVIKLKKKEGEASVAFGAEDGVYDLEIAYVDENDGQGSIVVEVNGVVVQTILLDQDNNGNGNDNSTISTVVIENLDLSQGDTITLRGTRDGREFARIDAMSFCPNNAPVAEDDAFSIGESGLVIEDILGNDSDADGDAIEIIDANGNPPATAFTVTSADGREATVIVAPNGALNFAADTAGNFEDLAVGETDTVTVTYTISDGNGNTDTADVVVTINGENDAPTAVADTFSTGESGVVIEDILGNDSDVDGSDTLSIISADGNAPGVAFTSTSAGGRDAAIIVAPNGALNFAADTAGAFEDLAVGETDTITVDYTISDGNGGVSTSTVTVTVNGENDGPTAEDNTFSIGESDFLNNGKLLANDSDVDATDELTIIEATANGISRPSQTAPYEITTAGGRTATIFVGDGQAASGNDFLLNTAGGFEDLAVGETDTATLTYTISDGNGGTDTAEVTVTINGENDGPTAVADAFATGESGIVIEDILGNDSDVDASDTLSIISADGNAPGVAFTSTSAGGRDAAIIVAPNGALNFAADTAGAFEDLAVGETDTITVDYTISDGNGGVSTSTVTVTVNGENDGPTAVADAFSTGESGVVIEDILGNDSDVDGSDSLSIISADGNAPGVAFTSTSAGGRDAAIIVAPDGALNFAADTAGAFEDLGVGETDTITVDYTISDGNGGVSTSTVTVTVNGENDAPTAGADAFAIGESGLALGDLLANDSDIDGDTVEIIAANGVAAGTASTTTSAGGRTASIIVAPSGLLNFAADTAGNFEDLAAGETDTITVTYTISDGNGGTSSSTVTVTVNGENDAPEALDDAFSVDEGVLLTENILGNDSDVDGSDALTITSANGVAPATAFTITSAGGRDAVGIVAPNGALNLAVDQAGNFEDLADGETDTVSITYTISDGNGGTDGAVATVTIVGQNDDPDAIDDAFTFAENGIDVGNLLLNDSDVDASDVLQITSANGNVIDPALGGATLFNVTSTNGRGAELVVTQNFGFNMAFNPRDEFQDMAVGETDIVTFTYDITDNNGGTDTASVTITVEGENDGPTAEDDAFNVDEGDFLTVDVLDNDSDVDASDIIEITGANGNATGVGFSVTSAGGRDGFAIVAPGGALNLAFDQIGGFEDLAAGETDTVTITYDITDGNGGTSSADAVITIDGQNDGPVAVDDAFNVDEGDFLTVDVLGNDSDVDATDVIEITGANGNATGVGFSVTSAGGRDGFAIVAPGGALNLAFDQIGGFEDLAVGETDTVTITYDITDGNGGTSSADAVITIDGQNDGPVAVDDAFEIAENDFLVVDVLGNDSDVDATDVLQITGANGNATGVGFSVTSAGGRDGFAIVAPGGVTNLAFDQLQSFSDLALGETDTVTITYDITDGNGGTDSADAVITVVGDGDVVVTENFTSNTPNTGQEVTISLNVDSATDDGTVDAEIDINFGAVIQPQINVVYVVDTSGSTIASVLAEEVAALKALTADIEAQGFAEGSVSISIVPFSTVSGPDATGDDSSTFVLDDGDDAGTTDLDDINAALDDLTGGGFTNYVEALGEATSILNGLDPTDSETNVVFFLSDGQPTVRDTSTGQITTQTEAEIAAAAAPLQAIAQISAFEIGNVDALQFLDALDNTGGAQSVTDPSDLSAALLGSPIPEGTVIDADLFIFDDSEVFGTLVQAIEIDVPGDVDDPANPNLVETPLGLELDLELSGLAADLGDANRVSLVVQFDDDGDGIVDLPLFVEVDVFGLA